MRRRSQKTAADVSTRGQIRCAWSSGRTRCRKQAQPDSTFCAEHRAQLHAASSNAEPAPAPAPAPQPAKDTRCCVCYDEKSGVTRACAHPLCEDCLERMAAPQSCPVCRTTLFPFTGALCECGQLHHEHDAELADGDEAAEYAYEDYDTDLSAEEREQLSFTCRAFGAMLTEMRQLRDDQRAVLDELRALLAQAKQGRAADK